MNIYGDHGNVEAVAQRCRWRGIEPEVIGYHIGAEFPAEADIILGGGGQDSGQGAVQADLPRIRDQLANLIASGAPTLVICGTYQLFGNYFKTIGGEMIAGLGIFDLHTVGGERRMIGNIVTESEEFGEIVGYENHSGITRLAAGWQPLGRVLQGDGNNGEDGGEGVRLHNAIGTYLHGPLLPKNPRITDFLISKAIERRYGLDAATATGLLPLSTLDDTLAEQARAIAKTRPR
jgi:CobQ-like glutamine amidotransferase family enzyme